MNLKKISFDDFKKLTPDQIIGTNPDGNVIPQEYTLGIDFGEKDKLVIAEFENGKLINMEEK